MPDGDTAAGASVEAILRAFNAPINQEQAYALCFQTVRQVTGQSIPAGLTTKHLIVTRDGTVRIHCPPAAGRSASEKDFLISLGRLLYSALDYGLSETEERVLDPELESFIVKLTTKEDEGSCDEGIENDEDESAPPLLQPLTRSSVLQICSAHLPPKTQPEAHFKAVCRALYVEYEELCAFLSQVSRGTSELKKLHRDFTQSSASPLERLRAAPELESLQSADWARVWMQVIRQLRNGVKLRKVECDSHLSRCEFELTPYEMLLNDIRLRRYKLKHVDQSDTELQVCKKDAHDVILDFIRSRPPLVPVSQRITPPTPPKEETMYERLMSSIRQGHPLRPVPTHRHSLPGLTGLGRVLTDLTPQTTTAARSLTPSPRKRIHIIPDLDLLSIESEDEDMPSVHSTIAPPSQVHEMSSNQRQSGPISVCQLSESRTRSPAFLPDESCESQTPPPPPFSLTIFFRTFARILNLTEKSQKRHNTATPLRHMCDTITDKQCFSDS